MVGTYSRINSYSNRLGTIEHNGHILGTMDTYYMLFRCRRINKVPKLSIINTFTYYFVAWMWPRCESTPCAMGDETPMMCLWIHKANYWLIDNSLQPMFIRLRDSNLNTFQQLFTTFVYYPNCHHQFFILFFFTKNQNI